MDKSLLALVQLVDLGYRAARNGARAKSGRAHSLSQDSDWHFPSQFLNSIGIYNDGVLTGRANALFSARRFEEALEAYGRAIKIEPGLARARIGRAITLYFLGQYEDALAECDRAAALSPEEASLHFVRGFVLLGIGLHEEALTALDRAVRTDHGLEQARKGRATTLMDKVCGVRPVNSSAWAHIVRGTALDSLGR
ncbi:MAG: tetratricopeptide repeat protein, partial [Thaumarchaeota archaeon S15]